MLFLLALHRWDVLWAVFELSLRYCVLSSRKERALAGAVRARDDLLLRMGEADVGSSNMQQLDFDYQALEECVEALEVCAHPGCAPGEQRGRGPLLGEKRV